MSDNEGQYLITRDKLIEAIEKIELRPVKIEGREKPLVLADDMADAILGQFKPVGENQLLDGLSRLHFITGLRHMTRSAFTEAMHTVRYVSEDLKALRTRVMARGFEGKDWEADAILELDSAIARLKAMRDYIAKETMKS